MILIRILFKIAIGVLLATIFGSIMYDDPFADWPGPLRSTMAHRIGYGFSAGVWSPFVIPNYLAFKEMGLGVAALTSGYLTCLFYSPFLVHWWIKRDTK